MLTARPRSSRTESTSSSENRLNRAQLDHQVLAVAPLDMGVEAPGRVAVQQGGDEGRLCGSRPVHEVIDRVAKHVCTGARRGTRAEAELALELGQRRVGEDKGGGRD